MSYIIVISVENRIGMKSVEISNVKSALIGRLVKFLKSSK